MNEPLTLHWESTGHYRSAMLMPDLFGGWVLVTTTGERDRRASRVRQQIMDSYEDGVAALNRLRHRRRREGYALRAASFTALEGFDTHAESVRAAETYALLRLFTAWDLGVEEQAALLDLDPRALDRLQDGQALRDDATLLARATHLLAINKALRLRFGADAKLKCDWLRRPCPSLQGQTPLAAMQESFQALAGLRERLGVEADQARGCQR
ncbi:MAG: DUF2384 domain-containing protein [Betaproteobacteria bacterium]|nr:DUF2384 domain-containing protein [Betaproteobacteria bacterium]